MGDSDEVTYTPISYLDEQKDKLISNVTSGSIPFLDVRSIPAPHQSQFNGRELSELLQSLGQQNSCIVLGDWAVSTAKLDKELANASDIVNSRGYFNVQVEFPLPRKN
jgi:hypothetical protein